MHENSHWVDAIVATKYHSIVLCFFPWSVDKFVAFRGPIFFNSFDFEAQALSVFETVKKRFRIESESQRLQNNDLFYISYANRRPACDHIFASSAFAIVRYLFGFFLWISLDTGQKARRMHFVLIQLHILIYVNSNDDRRDRNAPLALYQLLLAFSSYANRSFYVSRVCVRTRAHQFHSHCCI